MWKVEKTVKKGRYRYAVVPDHPKATKHGYVLEHRVVMENHLQRLLNSSEVVHHKDHNSLNNQVSNLEVKEASQHARDHGFGRGSIRVVFKCPNCGEIFERRRGQLQSSKPKTTVACSRACNGTFQARVRKEGRTHEVEVAISENIVREYRYFHDNSEETA